MWPGNPSLSQEEGLAWAVLPNLAPSSPLYNLSPHPDVSNCNPTLDLRGRTPQNLKHTWSVPSLRTSIGFYPQFSFDLEINSEYLSGFSTKTWLFCTDLWTVKKIGDLYSGPNFDIYCKILQLHPISTQNYHKLCKICVKYNSVQKLLHHFKKLVISETPY